MRRSVPTFLLRLCAVSLLTSLAAQAEEDGKPKSPARVKRLIEFGWDEPDTSFLRRHIAAMEKTPFDGCVFHAMSADPQSRRENFSWLCWGKRRFTEEELKPALEDLRATTTRRFAHNFLRFNTAPADLDWFDDHTAVLANARLAAEVAREGKCAGILFDVEEYQGKLFTFAKQRDAETKSWDEYAAQARRRGREVMAAFQEGFPDVTIFLTFGHSLPRTVSEDGKKPLAECDSGLLAPFLDGMIDGANGRSRIVDGFELSYSYKTRAQFDRGYRLMKEGVLAIVGDPAKYRQVVSSGFGLWLDYDWRKKGWDEADPTRNYFTPESFRSGLRHALERSDEYVWIYTETPRWWSEAGGPVKLPEAYDAAIRRARQEAGPD